MKRSMFGLFILMISCSLHAQQCVVKLYDGVASGSENWTQKEVEYTQYGRKMVRNVVNPTLTGYLPEESKATGAAVVVAPGGGFCWLSWENEGLHVGEWLQAHGIVAFVLKYRLADMGETNEELMQKSGAILEPMMAIAGSSNSEEELQKHPEIATIVDLAQEDGRQAIKHIRANAAKYNINPNSIGLVGFPAGGILALGVALNHDKESCPDFIAPIYGISVNGLNVPNDAAPMFLACALDDSAVAPHAAELYSAWQSAGKIVESHVYSKGGHGFGMRKQGLPIDNWIEQFWDWLEAEGFLFKETF